MRVYLCTRVRFTKQKTTGRLSSSVCLGASRMSSAHRDPRLRATSTVSDSDEPSAFGVRIACGDLFGGAALRHRTRRCFSARARAMCVSRRLGPSCAGRGVRASVCVRAREAFALSAARQCNNDGSLVDPASSHMLVSKIKPCMSQYKPSCTVKPRKAH